MLPFTEEFELFTYKIHRSSRLISLSLAKKHGKQTISNEAVAIRTFGVVVSYGISFIIYK